MCLESIKENDFVIIFKNYGKEFEKRKVKRNNDYYLELENGEKIYNYKIGSGVLDVIKYTEEVWEKAEIAYKAKMISYALNFNRNLRSSISKEKWEMIESILDKKEIEKTVSMAYTLGSLERENRFFYDFLIKENKKED